MSILVGVRPDDRDPTALHLAGMLARSTGEELIVCTVVPTSWPAGVGRIDAEYQDYLSRLAREALDRARAGCPADLRASYVATHGRSVPAGLLEMATEHEVDTIVVGSSSAGALGHVAVGSVGEWLLHSSPLPLALAPRGFRCRPGAVVTRVTAAFSGAPGSADLVVAAGRVAAQVGASLRIASFAVRPRTIMTAGVGSRAEDEVVREWVRGAEEAQRETLRQVADLPVAPHALTTVVGYGHDWTQALEDVEWRDGDVLVVGSSTVGPLARVFLGSRGSKIVRHAPVPVVVVPRGTVTDLLDPPEPPADQAQR
jgi:nucleotide-binding universal stress UspA family protein